MGGKLFAQIGVGLLRREAVDLAFEVKKLARQRAAPPYARGAQFRECAFGDALANERAMVKRELAFRILRIGPCRSRLGEDAIHRRCEHGVKCPVFAQDAFSLQTNGRRRSARGSPQ